jgi:dTMP kinase
MSKKKPQLIALEGIDGSGTSSQAQLLVDYLNGIGVTALLTSEPDEENPIGKFIRSILTKEVKFDLSADDIQVALSYLFAADRYVHTSSGWWRNPREQYDVVVFDRYVLSTFAYQLQSPKVDPTWLGHLMTPCPKADMIILLDCPADVAMERMEKRGEPSEIFEKEEFLKRVGTAYRICLGFWDKVNCHTKTIDGNRTVTEVKTDIHTAVSWYLRTYTNLTGYDGIPTSV